MNKKITFTKKNWDIEKEIKHKLKPSLLIKIITTKIWISTINIKKPARQKGITKM